MSDSSEAEFNDEMMEEEEEEEELEADEAEEDEEEPSGRQRAARKSVSYAEEDGDDDDSDDDSDDDIPLAALAAKAKKVKKETPKKRTNGAKQPKKSSTQKPPPPARKISNTSNTSDKKYEFASAALYQSESLKGLLIQRLLCRWWYAYTWPDPATLPVTPPKNYDTLDGFPGVYVCTQGDEVGKLMDMRDMTQCPSFRNFANKPAAELQKLLLKALENQKKQVLEHEGPESSVLPELEKLVKWTTKLDPNKAEKEATKVLKAAKLTL